MDTKIHRIAFYKKQKKRSIEQFSSLFDYHFSFLTKIYFFFQGFR